MERILLGIDVGGSSIKAGLVDVEAGRLVSELISTPTPQPASPQAVVDAIAKLVSRMPKSDGPVGFAFPSVVKNGKARTAANVDRAWIGTDGAALLGDALGRKVVFLNDADAAGIAEMHVGAGRGLRGTVIVLTFGTGIGSALFNDGVLWPNTEFGHVEFHGKDAELWASARVRTEERLDFPAWIERVNEFLAYMHGLLWPDAFIFGGGVSDRFDEFSSLLRLPCPVYPARLGSQAGVIGAALAAAHFG